MASAGDVKAGRAGVEMFMDLTELNAGINAAQQSLKNMDKNISAQKWATIANAAGVGLQDFVTVLSNGGTLGSAIGAISNNIIQIATLVSPLSGGYAAVGIAAFQAAMAGYKMFTAAKQTKEELEKARKEAEGLAKAKREAAAKAGEEAAKLRADSKDPKAMDKARERARDDVDEAQGREDGLRNELNRLQNSYSDDPEKEKQRKLDLVAAEKALKEAIEDTNKAREKVIKVDRLAQEGAKTQAEKDAEQAHRRADLLEAKANAPRAAGTWTPEQLKREQEEARAARELATDMTREAKRTKDFKPGTGAKAEAEKNSLDEQAQALADQQRDLEQRQAKAEELRKAALTPSEKADESRKEAQQLLDDKLIDYKTYNDRMRKIDQEYKQDVKALLPSGAVEDEELAEQVKKGWLSPEDRKKQQREQLDRLYGKGLLSSDEKATALRSLNEANQSVVGSFSGAALSGLGASTPLDAIQQATERTAAAAEKTEKNTRNGGQKVT